MSKDDVREYIYANAVLPWRTYKRQYPYRAQSKLQPEWIGHTSDDSTSVHIFGSPRNIEVIVAGGECTYSQIVRGSYCTMTKEIELPRNWAELKKQVP